MDVEDSNNVLIQNLLELNSGQVHFSCKKKMAKPQFF